MSGQGKNSVPRLKFDPNYSGPYARPENMYVENAAQHVDALASHLVSDGRRAFQGRGAVGLQQGSRWAKTLRYPLRFLSRVGRDKIATDVLIEKRGNGLQISLRTRAKTVLNRVTILFAGLFALCILGFMSQGTRWANALSVTFAQKYSDVELGAYTPLDENQDARPARQLFSTEAMERGYTSIDVLALRQGVQASPMRDDIYKLFYPNSYQIDPANFMAISFAFMGTMWGDEGADMYTMTPARYERQLELGDWISGTFLRVFGGAATQSLNRTGLKDDHTYILLAGERNEEGKLKIYGASQMVWLGRLGTAKDIQSGKVEMDEEIFRILKAAAEDHPPLGVMGYVNKDPILALQGVGSMWWIFGLLIGGLVGLVVGHSSPGILKGVLRRKFEELENEMSGNHLETRRLMFEILDRKFGISEQDVTHEHLV